MPSQPLTIKDWQNAVADSPYLGFGLMRNVDIEAFPNAVKVQKAPASLFVTAFAVTFTANAGTDVCTVGSGTVPSTGTAVTVSSTTTLPAGLSAATNYFIINVSSTTFKLATTIANANAGTAIDITDAGTGTHTVTSVNPGTVNTIIKDAQTGVRFLHDSNGRVWYLESGASRALLLNGNTLTNSSGKGLITFTNANASNTYLLVFRNAVIDVVTITATSNLENPSWTNGWLNLQTASGTANSHHTIVGQDNIIYYCDGRYVGSIREVTTFDPSSGATYSQSTQALDLPQGEIANHLAELGTTLLIAGNSYNKIYPWDRISDSFFLPIEVPEISIKKIHNIGGNVYILAGTKGNVYVTQGSYVRLAKKISDYLVNNSGSLLSNPVTWGGIAARNGALIFGLGGQTSGNSGVYILYPDGRLLQDNVPSAGSTNVTAIQTDTDFYFMGYASGADYSTTSRYTSFEGVIHSPFYPVGTKTGKATFSLLEVQLAKPASSGHVRISYRTDTSSSFTTLDSYTANSTTSFKSDIGLIEIENIQIQVEMDGEVELLSVSLFP